MQGTSLLVLLLRIASALILLVTVLPLLRTGAWYVRGWDFPRVQIVVVALLLLLGTALLRHHLSGHTEFRTFLVVLSMLVIWQTSHFARFTPVWPKEVPPFDATDDGLLVVVANLDYENQNHQPAVGELQSLAADVLVLIELDQEWERQLGELKDSFPHRHQEVRGEGLGLAVWSRLPLIAPETRYLVEDRRASIWTKLDFAGQPINLVALHPTPPGLNDSTGEERRDSRVRDAELLLVAKQVADKREDAWIVAGDFNDVAWSHTTRLFRRMSGLSDPRTGRFLLNSFHADYPLVRFPIDQIYVSKGFAISDLRRHRITGSDHFAIAAKFHHAGEGVHVDPQPVRDDKREAEEIIEEGQQDAQDRNVQSR